MIQVSWTSFSSTRGIVEEKLQRDAVGKINEGISMTEVKKCIICGSEFQPKKKTQICCKRECSLKRNYQLNRENYRDYYKYQMAEKQKSKKKAKKEKPKTNTEKIIEIDRLAKEAGMSYGQYEALKYMGRF